MLQTRYIYDEGIRLVGEVSPDGEILTHYIYADKSYVPAYMNRNGVNYKLVTNQQGSVRFVMLSTTGAVQQEMNYDEFGNVTVDTNPGFQPFGFAGGIYDVDTKLTRYGARDYDAETGRWMSKDPILFNGGDTNLYGYVLNDPINWIDPDGLISRQEQAPGGSGAAGYPASDIGIGIGTGIGAPMVLPNIDGEASCNEEPKGAHTKNKRKSTKDKHQEANRKRQMNQPGGEKGDARRPYRRK